MASNRNDTVVGVKNDSKTIDKTKITVIVETGKHFDCFVSLRKWTGKFCEWKIVVRDWKFHFTDERKQKRVTVDFSTTADLPIVFAGLVYYTREIFSLKNEKAPVHRNSIFKIC